MDSLPDTLLLLLAGLGALALAAVLARRTARAARNRAEDVADPRARAACPRLRTLPGSRAGLSCRCGPPP
jgi:hypothetical protein